MLTHLFTPAECAQCKLCCHFHRSSAWETPALEPSLILSLQAKKIPLEKRADGSVSFHLTFKTTSDEETCNCPMLDTSKGCTLPREDRPFECRIWPLRLMQHDGKLAIGLYQSCPALQPQVSTRLIAYATGELLPKLLQFAQTHPLSVRDSHPSYTIIWTAP